MNWTLFPASTYASSVATLWWVMLGAAGAVWVGVTASVLIAARRRRAPTATNEPFLGEESPGTRKAIFAAFIATAAILFFFMGYEFVLGRETPQHLHSAGGMDVTVQARQWWWEFIYHDSAPDKRLSVANELHVPVGVRINLILKAPDVIHSVWVPRLAGKQDAVPGYTGALSFIADTAGIYPGVCAEFCGAQHAKMRFTVIAHERKEFDEWYVTQRAPSIPPNDSLLMAGQRVFLSSSCSACHAIAGTRAFATRGPGLTHVGTRRDLAAGALPNTDANMMGWIANPQAIKPGTQMPATPLTGDQLTAVVAYLRSLK